MWRRKTDLKPRFAPKLKTHGPSLLDVAPECAFTGWRDCSQPYRALTECLDMDIFLAAGVITCSIWRGKSPDLGTSVRRMMLERSVESCDVRAHRERRIDPYLCDVKRRCVDTRDSARRVRVRDGNCKIPVAMPQPASNESARGRRECLAPGDVPGDRITSLRLRPPAGPPRGIALANSLIGRPRGKSGRTAWRAYLVRRGRSPRALALEPALCQATATGRLTIGVGMAVRVRPPSRLPTSRNVPSWPCAHNPML